MKLAIICSTAVAILLCFIGTAEAKPLSRRVQKQLVGLDSHSSGDEYYHNDIERKQFAKDMVDSILNQLVFCKRRVDARKVLIKSCRTAPLGCKARIGFFVDYILEASETYNINPFLLAAMAYNESRFNPFAEGPAVQSRGILQLNPKSKRGKSSPFARNGSTGKKYRKQCRSVPGNCQREIVFKAADHMSQAIRRCGNLAAGLSMYNTGRCDVRRLYVRNTAKAWRALQFSTEKKVPWCGKVKKGIENENH